MRIRMLAVLKIKSYFISMYIVIYQLSSFSDMEKRKIHKNILFRKILKVNTQRCSELFGILFHIALETNKSRVTINLLPT